MRARLIITVLLLATCTALYADSRAECSSVNSAILKRDVRYCALLPASYDGEKQRKYPILYFLHGLGDNEQALVNSGAWNIAQDLRRRGQIGDWLMVTPDGDRSFYIDSRDGRVRYEQFLVREFMPQIERKYRATGTRTTRAVSGVSMGGYGALRLAFKYPQMFAAVSAHMPALYEKLPPALAASAGDPRARRLDLHNVFGSPPDASFWQRNSPLTLARNNAAQLRRLRIYFDCGDQDEFGFDAGARALDRILSGNHVAHEFHIYAGGHDWMFVAAHFGDALKFAWAAMKP